MLLRWLFLALLLVRFCIETVPQAEHWLLEYVTCRGSGLFAVKTLDFESSIGVLKELGSLYKMDQLQFTPCLILIQKNGSIPFKLDLYQALKVKRFCREKSSPTPHPIPLQHATSHAFTVVVAGMPLLGSISL